MERRDFIKSGCGFCAGVAAFSVLGGLLEGCAPSGWKCLGNSTTATTFSLGNLSAGKEYFIMVDLYTIVNGHSETLEIICPATNVDCIPTTLSSSNTVMCAGTTQLLSTDAGLNSYQWYRNGVAINGATSNTYNASDAGLYTVAITNSCGSVTSNIATVSVAAPLTAGSHNVDPVTACQGYNPAALTIAGTTGGSTPYSYQWQLNGVDIPGANADTYDPPAITGAPGNYNFNCVITDACGQTVSTAIKPITIVADPIISISGGPTASVCLNGSLALNAGITGGTGTMNFQWEVGTSTTGPWTDITGATNNTYSPPTNVAGTFLLSGRSFTKCSLMQQQ